MHLTRGLINEIVTMSLLNQPIGLMEERSQDNELPHLSLSI